MALSSLMLHRCYLRRMLHETTQLVKMSGPRGCGVQLRIGDMVGTSTHARSPSSDNRNQPSNSALGLEKVCQIMSTSHERELGPLISAAQKSRRTIVVGVSGTGKTTLFRSMVLKAIGDGHGVAIIDPHGDLAESILRSLPDDRIDDVVYLNPGDPKYCPLWNPLRSCHNFGLVSREIVRAIGDVDLKSKLSHKSKRLLRQVLLGVLHLENATIALAAHVLSGHDNEEKRLRRHILETAEYRELRQVWDCRIKTQVREDLAVFQHRLARLLCSGVGLMLCQAESRFDLDRVVCERMLFIANLSGMSMEVRPLIGRLILSLLRAAAIANSTDPKAAPFPFHIYVDDAGRCARGMVKDFLRLPRRFRVSVALADQSTSQIMRLRTMAAFAAKGVIIAFKVCGKEAKRLGKMLGVKPQRLPRLEDGEAIARIGNDVLRVKVPPMRSVPDTARQDKVVQISYQRYYRPIGDVRGSLNSDSPSPRQWSNLGRPIGSRGVRKG